MTGFLRTALALSALLFVAPVPPAPAQIRQTPGCTQAIAQVSRFAEAYGGKVAGNGGIEWRTIDRRDNPTRKTGELSVVFSPKRTFDSFRSNDLMEKADLQQWANNLAQVCSNVAVISFGIANSDYILEFAMNKQGALIPRECVDSVPRWNEMNCL